jgi:hypothetical protein
MKQISWTLLGLMTSVLFTLMGFFHQLIVAFVADIRCPAVSHWLHVIDNGAKDFVVCACGFFGYSLLLFVGFLVILEQKASIRCWR